MLRQLSVEELCSKLKPVFGKKIDDLYLKYAMAESREEKEDMFRLLSVMYHKNLNELLDNKVLLSPPKVEDMNGSYNLAKISYSGKDLFDFNLREKDWPRHVCVSGMSGSGKTTFAFSIMENLIKHDKSFLVFDWKKSFRPLLAASPEVMCFTVGNKKVTNLFKMNINRPPRGIDPKEWINVLCDLLTETFSVSYGVHKVLLETLDASFKEWGVYDGSENYPTWNHIKWYLEEKMKKIHGREGGWIESALRIATVLTFGNFGEVCNYKEKDSLSVEDLLDKKVIFELNALSTIEKKFFCEFVLTYIYKFKKAKSEDLGGKFDHAILVDEAHNIFLKTPTNFAKESVTDMIYREMREYGTSLICLDQHISKLSDTVKGNSACQVAFQQQLPADIYDISGLMQLQDQKEYFSMLPVGTAIVKLSERYTRPFLINVPLGKLKGCVVNDSAIINRTKNVLAGVMSIRDEEKDFFNSMIQKQEPAEIDVYIDHVEVKTANKEKKIVEKPVVDKGGYFSRYKTPGKEHLGKAYSDDQGTPSTKPILNPALEAPAFIFTDTSPFGRLQKLPKEGTRTSGEAEDGAKEMSQGVFEMVTSNVEQGELVSPRDDSVEPNERNVCDNLIDVQKVLYDFVKEKISVGRELKYIEELMEENRFEGKYSLSDIAAVINHVTQEKFSESPEVKTFSKSKIVSSPIVKTNSEVSNSVTTLQEQQNTKVYKTNNISENNDLSQEQEMFLSFLRENVNQEFGTTGIYKALGLSARKGNKIKTELMQKNLIQITELKNEKGWKKIISLA